MKKSTAILLIASVLIILSAWTGEAPERPQTKVGTILIEGMEEDMKLFLHENEDLGFSTYIPEDMVVETTDHSMNVYFQHQDQKIEDAKLNIFTNHYETVEETADFINDKLTSQGFEVIPSEEHAFGFSKEEFSLRTSTVQGKISIFEYNDHIYGLVYYYPPEYGDGFEPRMRLVLDEIVWFEEPYK